MGTNKRYADSIDRRSLSSGGRVAAPTVSVPADATSAQPAQAAQPAVQPALRDWQPPWPPIRIGEAEWIIMRESTSEPAAIVRVVRIGPRNGAFYRVVTWAPTSEARTLVGYFATLAEADRAVLFRPTFPPATG
jgi:hypothetical protein